MTGRRLVKGGGRECVTLDDREKISEGGGGRVEGGGREGGCEIR